MQYFSNIHSYKHESNGNKGDEKGEVSQNFQISYFLKHFPETTVTDTALNQEFFSSSEQI